MVLLLLIVLTIALDTIDSGKICNKFNQNWSCCYNQYFDKTIGKCVECRGGSIGWNCNTTCINGYYGHLCREHCGCEAHLCDAVLGCPKQTKAGYLTFESHMCNPVTGCHQQTNIVNNATYQTMTDLKTNSTSNNPTGHPILHGISKPENKQTKRELKQSTPTSGTVGIESTNKPSNESNDWLLLFFLFITSLISIFIGGVLLYLRPLIKRRIISREHHNQERERRTPVNPMPIPSETNVPTVTISSVDERSSNYEDIRYSNMVRYKHNFHEQHSSSNGGAKKNHCKMICARSVLDDKFIDHDDDVYSLLLRATDTSSYQIKDKLTDDDNNDYNLLLLRKKRSLFAARNNILLEAEDYAYVQRMATGKQHLDFTIRRSQSLSPKTGRQHLDFTKRSKSLSQATGKLNPNLSTRRSQSLSRVAGTPHPDLTITRSQSLLHDTFRPHLHIIFRGTKSLPSVSRNQREKALKNYRLVRFLSCGTLLEYKQNDV